MRNILSVSLPKELAAELKRVARETGRNRSDLVRESISLYLWESRFNATRRSLSAKAKKKGVITEEDVFTAVS